MRDDRDWVDTYCHTYKVNVLMVLKLMREGGDKRETKKDLEQKKLFFEILSYQIDR